MATTTGQRQRSGVTPGQNIIAGLEEAVAWSRGEPVPARTTRVEVPKMDVLRIRTRLDLSQREFAARFGFAIGSVQNWEQGRRQPEGSARILMAVIDRHPEVVEEVLRAF